MNNYVEYKNTLITSSIFWKKCYNESNEML